MVGSRTTGSAIVESTNLEAQETLSHFVKSDLDRAMSPSVQCQWWPITGGLGGLSDRPSIIDQQVFYLEQAYAG
jgi:hypothetical protein